MQFTNPIWLWALTGLAVPIGIHLLSRREGKIIPIGSLRHLRESPTAQFRHIRLNEFMLLFLRCLLLTLLVFLLAGLTTTVENYGSKKWLVIEKGAGTSEQYAQFIDSLIQQGFEAHLLSEGFPPAKDSTAAKPITDYWAAAAELGARELDSAVVISFSHQKNFVGVRLSLPAHISWFMDEQAPKKFLAWKTSFGKDSTWARTGETSSIITKFETKKEPSSPDKNTVPPDTIRISIFADKEFSYDLKIIQATLKAIQTSTPHPLLVISKSTNEPALTDSSWVIWLSTKTFPFKHKKSIAFSSCQSDYLRLLTRSEEVQTFCKHTGASWIITQRLHEEIVLKENFAIRLAAILLPQPKDAFTTDNRILPEQMMWSDGNKKNNTIVKAEINDAVPMIIILMAMLTLISERILAYQRKQ